MTKMGQKSGFSILQKVDVQNLLDFLHQVTLASRFKIESSDFSKKNISGIFGPRRVGNVLKFYQKLIHELFFLILCMKLQ